MTDQSSLPEPSETLDELARRTIGAAIEVHRHLGPGFLESVYEQALCLELADRDLGFDRQVRIDVFYKGKPVGNGLADIIVEDALLLELKSVSQLAAVHRAQTKSYLWAANLRLGLLLNFNSPLLKDGLERIINPDARERVGKE